MKEKILYIMLVDESFKQEDENVIYALEKHNLSIKNSLPDFKIIFLESEKKISIDDLDIKGVVHFQEDSDLEII